MVWWLVGCVFYFYFYFFYKKLALKSDEYNQGREKRPTERDDPKKES